MHLALLVVSLLQSGTWPSGWVQITKNQIESSRVVNIDAKTLRLVKCREVKFESTGLDVITESSFTTVVAVVIECSGKVQQFRVVRGPEFPVQLSEPLRLALAGWRYEAAKPTLAGAAFEIAVALPKRLGAMETTACRSK